MPAKGAKFIVHYDEKGEIIQVIPGEGSKIVKQGEGPIPSEFLMQIMQKQKWVEIKTTPLLHAYSSPGCWIIVAGRWYCIC